MTRSTIRSPLLAALLATPCGLALAQEAPPPFETVAHVHDTGEVRNDSSGPRVVASFVVQHDGADWLRLRFEELRLAGDPFAGDGARLLIQGLADGAVQELDSITAAQWQQRSAYFNGDALLVEIVAQPGTGPSRLRLAAIEVGTTSGWLSICGPTDDRVLSGDPRAARLMPSGCSGWLIDDCNHCFLTAGHCGNVNVVQFNVPPSGPGGTINHPPPSDQYAVDPNSMQGVSGGTGDDWRYFGAFANSTTGLTPVQAQGAFYVLAPPPSFGPGQNVRITGYGVDSSPSTSNQVQQTHVGPRVSASGTTVRYVTDTEPGNSGSPVIWEQGGTAIGIHTHGGCTPDGGSNAGTASTNPGLQAALADPRGVCAVGIHLVGGAPDLLPAGVSTKVDLVIYGSILPGSARLLVSYDGGSYLSIPLAHVSGDLYQATLPPPVCGASPRYYFAVTDLGCGPLTLPQGAPAQHFQALVGVETLVFQDEMESALGWTAGVPGDTAITGTWVRVDPNGTLAQPEDDHTPSGTHCFVTGQGPPGGNQGDADIDGGSTTLLSPSFDLSQLADPRIDYWRWYSNGSGGSPGTDVLVVELSGDGGQSWALAETVGPTGPETLGGWVHRELRVRDLLAPSSDMRLRLVASDLGAGSIVEAALDDFRVRDVPCTQSLADCNGNGILDADDIASGRSADADANGIPDECIGDCNGNGVPDGQDIANGTSADCNANGLPDECELAANPYCFCAAAAPCSNPDPTAGCANSTGQGARLAACGSSGVAADDLVLRVTNLPRNQSGLVFMGAGEIQLPFGDGLRCVGAGGAGTFRFPIQNAGPGGSFARGPGIVAHSLASFPAAGHITAGSTWRFQGWYRNPSGPCGSTFNLSNAIRVHFSL